MLNLLNPTIKILLGCLLLADLAPAKAAEATADWLSIVRATPYWDSQGVAANLATVRSWVLFGSSYCSVPERHILFNHRGRFLGYIEDAETPAATISLLNEARHELSLENITDAWSPGSMADTGYPFALACDQPYFDFAESIARVTGEQETCLVGTMCTAPVLSMRLLKA